MFAIGITRAAFPLLVVAFFTSCKPDKGMVGVASGITMTASANSLSLAQGATTGNTVLVSIARSGDFNGAVNLVLSSSPTGILGTFSPAQLAGGSSTSTLTITVPAAQPAGNYTLTITGSGTGIASASATVALTVTASALPSITLATSVPTLSLAQGATTGNSATVTLARLGGFTGAVNLALSSNPAGITGAFNPVTLASGATTSTLTINVPLAQATGNYTLTITASGAGVANAVATIALVVTPAPAISLTPSSGTISLNQGATTGNTLTITLNRIGGFTGAVNLSMSSNPLGITGTFNPAMVPTGVTTSTLTITVPGGVAAGAYTLTIVGTGTGVTNALATVALTVVPGNITVTFCAPVENALWLAFQDGTGAWTAASGGGATYNFNIASGRGGMALVTPYPSGGFLTNIRYGTTAELQAYALTLCGTPGTKTLNFTVTGVGGVDLLSVAVGAATVTRSGSNPFSLANVRAGSQDLLATRATANVTDRMIIRRNQDYPANSNVPLLDFAAAVAPEWFAPELRTLSIANLGADRATSDINFLTRTGGATFGSRVFMNAEVNTFNNVRQIAAVPLARQAATDLHQIEVRTNPAGTGHDRSATILLKDPTANTVLTLPTQVSAPVVSRTVMTPYPMPRLQYTTQADVDDLIVLHILSFGGAAGRREANIVFSGAYLGSTQNIDWQFPNWTGLPLFQGMWMLDNAQLAPRMEAYGMSGPIGFTPGLTTRRLFWEGL